MRPKIALLGALAFLAFFQPSNCFAYKQGIHFYLTYVLGYWCGFDRYTYMDGATETYAIAWSNYITDRVDETDPGARPDEWLDYSKDEIRRVFHFPTELYDTKVVHASSFAYQNFNTAMKLANQKQPDSFLIGLSLHSLQDSWSHEGYTPEWGHIWTTAPDYPYNDINKAMEMAEATWFSLGKWMKQVHGRSCKARFKDFAGVLRTWFEIVADDAEELKDDWRKNVEAVTGKPISIDRFSNNENWRTRFLDAAQVFKENQTLHQF